MSNLTTHRRRPTLALILIVISAIGIVTIRHFSRSDPDQARPSPNILFVIIDSTRADYFPDETIGPGHMPFMSRMQAEGARFTAAQAAGTWTRLSIASLLTGTNVGAHGFSDWHLDQRVVESMSPEFVTLPEALRGGGYETAAFALSGLRDGFYATEFGFARGFDFVGETAAAFEGRTAREYPHLNRLIDREIIDAASQWLARRSAVADRRPLFLYVHIVGPHDPYDPPPGTPVPQPYRNAVARMHSDQFSGEPYAYSSVMSHEESMRHREGLRGLYATTLAWLDGEMERFVSDAREKLGNDRPLLTIITSDHGEALWEHEDAYMHGPAVVPYEELTNVPLIIHFPEVIKATRIEKPVSLVDLYPTIMELAGLAVPVRVQGKSLVPLLLGTPRSGVQAQVTEGSFGGPTAVRVGNWKYIVAPVSDKNAEPREMLFDLLRDPGELENLASSDPDHLSQMRAVLTREVLARARGLHLKLQPERDATYSVTIEAAGGVRRYLVYDLESRLYRTVRAEGSEQSVELELQVPGGRTAGLVFEPLQSDDLVKLRLERDGRVIHPSQVVFWPTGPEVTSMPLSIPYDRLVRISPDSHPRSADDSQDVMIYAVGPPTLDSSPMSEETRERLRALGYLR